MTVAIVMLAIACSGGPRPIAYGRADCTYCRMRIDDPRFGGEIVSAHGKVLQFDAVECMASYYRALPDRGSATSLWVADFDHPGTLLPVASAQFVRITGGTAKGSPMGGLLAVRSGSDVRPLRAQLGDLTTMTWNEVVADTTHAAATHGEAGGVR
ncbi:MAG TPA: nitrous oxide reductase accessory protein NosL [Candidatus Elarobacter sp.]|nr:nitrous oxide reductase accessory protein NosL [Candidatus Elarobacter sp.]